MQGQSEMVWRLKVWGWGSEDKEVRIYIYETALVASTEWTLSVCSTEVRGPPSCPHVCGSL